MPNQWIKPGSGLSFSLPSGLLNLGQVLLVPCCLVMRRFKDVLSIHVFQKLRTPPRECTRSSKSSSLCPGLSSLS